MQNTIAEARAAATIFSRAPSASSLDKRNRDVRTLQKRLAKRHNIPTSNLPINSGREAIKDDISQSFGVGDLIIFGGLYCDALRAEAEWAQARRLLLE
jgi:hypothetical protein